MSRTLKLARWKARKLAPPLLDQFRAWHRFVSVQTQGQSAFPVYPDGREFTKPRKDNEWCVPGVYAVWRGPRLLYIGSSKSLAIRIDAQWMSNCFRFACRIGTHVTVIATRNEGMARSLETALIEALLPIGNGRFNRKLRGAA